MKKLNKLLLPFATLSVATILPTVVLANCSYSKDEQLPISIPTIDFSTCSWSDLDTLCQLLEKEKITEAEFCSHFIVNSNPISSLDELIGLEKTIVISNNQYTVRIVATNHDTISLEGKLNNKKAVITFEMENLLSDSNGDMLLTRWYYKEHNFDYPNSELRANLNGTGNGTATWSITALDMLSDEKNSTVGLANAIKPTVHYIATRDTWESTEWHEETYTDKLYVPSYQNMSSTTSRYCKESQNTAFKYYADLEAQSSELATEARIKKDLNGNNTFYWVASPYSKYENDAWSVETDGTLDCEGVNSVAGGATSFAFSI